jgi:two-component system, LuxR family, sensor kinase FixL
MVVQDVTERRRLELELLRIDEDVRRDVGRDLHDGLGSHLTGVAMMTRRLARNIRRGRNASADEGDEIAGLIAEGNEQARRLARGLNPVVIERDGFCAALASLASSMQSMGGPRCVLGSIPAGDGWNSECPLCPPGFPQVDLRVATHLYRIAQEAAHNALRHSGAEEIRIDIEHHQGHVQLTVADDGVGFDPAASRGMGISVMQYRARLIGGSLAIRSRPGGGTVISCELPADRVAPVRSVPADLGIPQLCCVSGSFDPVATGT